MKAELTVELDLGNGTDGDKQYKAFYGLLDAAYAIMQKSEEKFWDDIGSWDVRVDGRVIGTATVKEEHE